MDKVRSSDRRTYIPVDGASPTAVVHLLPGQIDGTAPPPAEKRSAARASTESDEAYFLRRASEERAAAMQASVACARTAHLKLAGRYAELAATIRRVVGAENRNR